MSAQLSNNQSQREGVLVSPYDRLSIQQLEAIHQTSLEILENVGIICNNARAIELFRENGADTCTQDGTTIARIPAKLVEHCIRISPSRVLLGARNPDNRLILDAEEPRVRFGTGSETNIWLDIDWRSGLAETVVSGAGSDQKEVASPKNVPTFHKKRGALNLLCNSARLC
ncbi:MAG: trimethylamine methyltransferase family protein, partial [Candidatus Hydrogenedentota bacterium]